MDHCLLQRAGISSNGRPVSYWESCCVVKGRSRDHAWNLAEALHEAEESDGAGA